jgi:hypothetical protein
MDTAANRDTATELGGALLALSSTVDDADAIDASRAWRPMSLSHLRSGYVVVLRPTRRVPGRDDSSYWCGHVDWESFVNWLQYRDPLTDELTAAPVAVYTTRTDAAAAWADFLADHRDRYLPCEDRTVEIVPLSLIADLVPEPAPVIPRTGCSQRVLCDADGAPVMTMPEPEPTI